MRPVCFKCRCELRPLKNDFIVEEMADAENPYRVWSTDLWHCVSCGAKVIMGFGKEPIAEQFERDYESRRKEAQIQYWPDPAMIPTFSGGE